MPDLFPSYCARSRRLPALALLALTAWAAAALPLASRAAGPGQQPEGGGSPPGVTVTLSARGEDVRSVLKAAFAKSPGVRYRIDEGVRGTVTVAVRDVTLEAALRSIVRANTSPLELRRDEAGVWIVAPRRRAAAAGEPAQGDPGRVTLRVVDARLGDVLSELFDRAPNDAPHFGAKYRSADAAAGGARVTVRIEGLPLAEALDRIARAAQPRLAWRRTPENVYEFRTAEATRAATPPSGGSAPAPDADLPRVNVDVRDGDVRSVLADVFRQAKVANYTIANDVIGYVTLKMKDRPLDEALTLICRTAVPPLRYRRTPEGVYEVRVRTYGNAPSLAAAAPQAAGDAAFGGGTAAALPTRSSDWEAIPLMYAEADVLTEAMRTLRPEGITRIIGYLPTNTLIARGGDPSTEGFLAVILGYGIRGVGGSAGAGPGGAAPAAGGGGSGGPAAQTGGGGNNGGGGAANP